MKYKIIPILHLQLFAEGGAAGGNGSGDGAGVSGVNAPAAGVQTGEETAPAAGVQEQAVQNPDRAAEFERLIKGEYKDLYDADVQRIVRGRLKGSQETADRLKAVAPILDRLAEKYGFADSSDIAAIQKAVEADESHLEEEAMRLGISVEELKQRREGERRLRAMEAENAELRDKMQEQERRENAARLRAEWASQADEAKKVYPGLDLQKELKDKRFTDLLLSNIDVRTAYEVVHKDEIISGAMQFASQTAANKVAQSIAANGKRPTENGLSSQGAALTSADITKMTREERDAIRRRVASGEKIRL